MNRHNNFKTVLFSIIPAITVVLMITAFISIKNSEIKKQHENDIVFSADEFLSHCTFQNFEINGDHAAVTGPQPQIFFENESIASSKYVIITLSDLSTSASVRVFGMHDNEWVTDEKNSIKPTIAGQNILELSSTGLTSLRFDFDYDAGQSMIIDSVAFSNTSKTAAQIPSKILLYIVIILFALNALIVFCVKTFFTKNATGILENSNRIVAVNPVLGFIEKIFPVVILTIIFGIYVYKPIYLIFDSPEYTQPGYATARLSWLLAQLIITAATIIVIFLIIWIIRGNKLNVKNERTERIIAASVLFSVFILIFINELSLFTENISYDNIYVRSGALGIINDGVISEQAQGALTLWSNNRGIVLFLGIVGRFANGINFPYRILWLFVDSLFVTLSIAFVYLTVKLFCNRNISLLSLILSSAFLVFASCVTPLANTNGDWYILYTDSMSMPFTAMSVYCFARFLTAKDKEWKQLLLVLLGSLTSTIGSIFKPTAFVTLIAFAVITLFKKEKALKIAKHLIITLRNAVIVAISILVVLIPFNKVYDHYETIESNAKSENISRWIILGMLNTGQNINHNGVMVFEDSPSLNPFQDRGRWNYGTNGFDKTEVLKARIKHMKAALLGFYYLKDVNNFGFTYEFHSTEYVNGRHPESHYKTAFLAKWRDVLLTIQTPVRAVLWNVMFFGIGIWSYILLKKKIKLSHAEGFLSVVLLGIVGVMTLFESGDRYAMQFWPMLLIVANLGFMRLKIAAQKKRKEAE